MGLAAWFGIWMVGAAFAGNPPTVLVRADAPLHSQPDASADKAKLKAKSDWDKDPAAVGYAELVSRDDDWVLLRTSIHGSACTRPVGTNAPVGMLLWVRPKNLVKVVNKPFTFTDGAATVQVFPGVPVRENVDATITVAAKGLQVTGNFPTDHIGNKFVPATVQNSSFMGTHGASGVYGTDGLKIEIADAPVSPAEGEDTWALERRCVRAVGPRVEGAAPVEGAGSPDVRGGTARRSRESVRLEEGTVLQWPDGVYAGTTAHGYRLITKGVESPPGLSCGKVQPGLVVCAPNPEAVDKAPPVRHIALKLKAENRKDPKPPKGHKGEAAKCRVQVDVSKSGQTQEVQVSQCAEAFEEVTKEAVTAWTWKPYEVDGAKVPSRHWLWVRFPG